MFAKSIVLFWFINLETKEHGMVDGGRPIHRLKVKEKKGEFEHGVTRFHDILAFLASLFNPFLDKSLSVKIFSLIFD